jgi:hypothetical protein
MSVATSVAIWTRKVARAIAGEPASQQNRSNKKGINDAFICRDRLKPDEWKITQKTFHWHDMEWGRHESRSSVLRNLETSMNERSFSREYDDTGRILHTC